MEVEIYQCPNPACKHKFVDAEADSYCLDASTRDEPGEWAVMCPECGAVDGLRHGQIKIIYEVVCYVCEEVIVQHDGEMCSECRQVHDEARWDLEHGH